MKNETKFNKRPYAKNELVASYDTLKIFQTRGLNIQFKEFSTEIVTLSINSCMNVDQIHIAILKETI